MVGVSPQIITIPEKKLVGKHVRMSLSGNRTAELWRSFMPQRRGIINPVGTELISMSVYDPGFDMSAFTPAVQFDKWAAVEVTTHDSVPEGMERFVIPEGLYAVFLYKGHPLNFAPMFQYIFRDWLPASGYELDARPHFEVMGAKYDNNSDASEEDLYIPIRRK